MSFSKFLILRHELLELGVAIRLFLRELVGDFLDASGLSLLFGVALLAFPARPLQLLGREACTLAVFSSLNGGFTRRNFILFAPLFRRFLLVLLALLLVLLRLVGRSLRVLGDQLGRFLRGLTLFLVWRWRPHWASAQEQLRVLATACTRMGTRRGAARSRHGVVRQVRQCLLGATATAVALHLALRRHRRGLRRDRRGRCR